MKITVAGAGYVGLSVGILLAQHNDVTIVDVVKEKIDLLNEKRSPIRDKEISDYLAGRPGPDGIVHPISLRATLNEEEAYKDADLVIVAAPTNYDPDLNFFDTRIVENVIDAAMHYNDYAMIVIKSTIPVGYTKNLSEKLHTDRICFSPEFLRESRALYDNLYPSRIIVGTNGDDDKAKMFADLLKEGAIKEDTPVLIMNTTEAEAVKLFSNTYLALRVSYFNELDTYAQTKGLSSKNIIEGISFDPRIGNYYNNPSFGYGGYCLPKDTKQLLANYRNIPENMITATVMANTTRKDFIAKSIMDLVKGIDDPVIGVYRLIMKSGSDNFRQSAIFGVIRRLKKHGLKIVIYEPTIREDMYEDMQVMHDLEEFKKTCACIVANRYNEELSDVREKVYTRDIFEKD